MNVWADLESPLKPEPLFFVEAPDDRCDWSEIDRQATFLGLMRMAAPRIPVHANANAGKRALHVARKEGIRSGVFDLTIQWRGPMIAHLEFKGWRGKARKQAGKLTDNQIEWGNRMTDLGIPVACFFSPYNALDWVRQHGFPIAQVQS